jgi:hypothetical protein
MGRRSLEPRAVAMDVVGSAGEARARPHPLPILLQPRVAAGAWGARNKILRLLPKDMPGGRQVRNRAREPPIVSAIAVILSSCSHASDRDVLAYHACLARHPRDVVLCEGPRQAYEIDPSLLARPAAIRSAAPIGFDEGLAAAARPPRLVERPGCPDCFK